MLQQLHKISKYCITLRIIFFYVFSIYCQYIKFYSLNSPTATWIKPHPPIGKLYFPSADLHLKIINICFSLFSRSVNQRCSAGCCNNILSLLRIICFVENTVQIRRFIHNSLLTSWEFPRVRYRFVDNSCSSETKTIQVSPYGGSLLWQDTQRDNICLMDDSYHSQKLKT